MKSSHSSSQSADSDPRESLYQRLNNNKFTSISIYPADDFDTLINTCLKDSSNIFPNILPQLKCNDPTPTFPSNDNLDAIWDNSGEFKAESLKNRNSQESDKMVNVSVIENENICGEEGASGDSPSHFYPKVTDYNHENSQVFAETKAEVINGDEILNMSSFVSNLNLNDLLVLRKYNQTFISKKNRDGFREKNLKKRECGIKVKPVKIGKIEQISTSQVKITKPIRKAISLSNVFKPTSKFELSPYKTIKPISTSQVPNPPVLSIQAQPKNFPHKKSSVNRSLALTNKSNMSPTPKVHLNPYLQEFKKPILSSLLPPKNKFKAFSSLPTENSTKKKKRIKIF